MSKSLTVFPLSLPNVIGVFSAEPSRACSFRALALELNDVAPMNTQTPIQVASSGTRRGMAGRTSFSQSNNTTTSRTTSTNRR